MKNIELMIFGSSEAMDLTFGEDPMDPFKTNGETIFSDNSMQPLNFKRTEE
jgi:hypothetical protein